VTILEKVISSFSRLPGIGRKSASRIVYFLLKSDAAFVESFSRGIRELREKIKACSVCGNYTEIDPCNICTDTSREKSKICVVEQPKDIHPIELTKEYTGFYHVLMGVISPIEGIGPKDLTIGKLLSRIKNENIKEIIIATNPTVEGETTALYLVNQLKPFNIKITRLALGLPLGGDLEYADSITLGRALKGRNEI